MKKRILAILMAAIMCCLQLAEFVPAEKVKAAYSVSEEDIYYRCPEYLDNKAYDNYMARCEERIEKGMSTINDAEGLGASILYSLQNGADIIISELASKAGIGQSTKDKLNKEVVYPHSFRHRFAKNFLDRFNDLALLADLMGHESIETTRIYLRRTASEQQKIVDKVVNW